MNTLRQARKNKNLTQTELALMIGSNQALITSVELGKGFPDPDTRQRIEQVLGQVDWMATRVSGLQTTEDSRNILLAVSDYCHQSTATDREARKHLLIQYIQQL